MPLPRHSERSLRSEESLFVFRTQSFLSVLLGFSSPLFSAHSVTSATSAQSFFFFHLNPTNAFFSTFNFQLFNLFSLPGAFPPPRFPP